MLTLEMMKALWPHGNSKIAGLIEGIAATAPTVFSKYGMSASIAIAQSMSQFSHECGAGTEMVENINYSAARASQVWPSRFTGPSDVYRKIGSFEGDPEFAGKLIDNVYGSRMGNRPGTHDGRDFIGRGLPQTTGREGYENLKAKTGLDVVNHPELVSAPDTALECGVADFVLCGCLPFAMVDDTDGVTKHLNGGYIGLAERKAWLVKWKAALVQDGLNRLGETLSVDGAAGTKTQNAIKAFQSNNSMFPNGVIDLNLMNAIDAKTS